MRFHEYYRTIVHDHGVGRPTVREAREDSRHDRRIELEACLEAFRIR